MCFEFQLKWNVYDISFWVFPGVADDNGVAYALEGEGAIFDDGVLSWEYLKKNVLDE